MRTKSFKRIWIAAALLILAAGAAQAQLQTGNLYGTASDNQGEALPGVTVTVTGIGAPKVQVTNAEGQFRFLGLDPGGYKLEASLEGFSTVEYPNVDIRVGRNTSLTITLAPAVEDVITVTSESPLLDERKLGTGTTVTSVELEKIPSSRDPWALLNQAPGVQVDRINVGGNESGQQSVFVGTGASSNDNSFAVDGVVITDMSAIGSSPTYYDFDAFEEMQLSTGGTDISAATGGVTVNLVTKRGTNEWKGSARYLNTDSGLQSNSGFSVDDLAPAQRAAHLDGSSPFLPNEIDEITDQGLDVGGFLIKDRLWIWGAYGEQDIINLVAGGTVDATTLENYNAKINAQLSASNSGLFQFSRGDKIKNGRGAGPQRPSETTWDQSGPTEIWKLEDTHIFNSNFYLTGLYSFVDGGFALAPKGGVADQVLLDAGGVWRRTFADFGSDRDVDQWRIDGSYFFNTGDTAHELKFGTSYREAETAGGTKWGGGVIVFEDEGPGGVNQARVYRGENPSNAFTSEYQGLWIQDTLTHNKLTVNIGLRYDAQEGANTAFALEGNPLAGNLLPTLEFQGNDADGISFEEITPRVGLTYALGENRDTLLRFSYSRFAQQLQQGLISRANPLSPAFAFFEFTDTNGNLEFDAGEPNTFLAANGFDPANPTALSSPNRNLDLDPEITDEINLGIEHSLRPEFVVGLNLTWRNISDIHERAYLVRDAPGAAPRVAGPGDFAQTGFQTATLPDGSVVTVPQYALTPEFTGGYALRNGDREQDYLGLSANFTKRLTNRWMLRGHFTYYDWEWDIPSNYFFDLNDLAPGERPETGIDDDEDFDNNGVPVSEQSGGSGDKGDILLNSRWSFNVNGLYQVAPDRPWGFNVAANISGREGYPLPYYLNNINPGDGIQRDLQVSRTGEDRNDNLYSLDLRLDKDFEFGDWGLTLSIDAFNLLNEGTVLQRERNLGGSQPNFVDETLSPRVFRLGLRLSFR